jgi:hypothetical protein
MRWYYWSRMVEFPEPIPHTAQREWIIHCLHWRYVLGVRGSSRQ